MRLISRFTMAICSLLLMGASTVTVLAAAPPPQNPQSGSVGLEGTISTAPPTQAATIATPSSGATVSNIPVTVSGLCPTGLLAKVFANNVFVGSVMCDKGSYEVQIDLFSGRNDIVTRVYDALDQAGPDSNLVSVTFNDSQVVQFGSRVSLTSDYARRGANPGNELDWPIALSGGTPPYALSIDWGDGSNSDLQSIAVAGAITLKHTYTSAGTYRVVVKATDANGTAAFLQLVGVANGAVQGGTGSSGATSGAGSSNKTASVLWWPAAATIPFVGVTFWLGRRSELHSIRKQLEQARNQ